jgi:2,3-bisphosphoglycerate-dependent phosphoglycerate mutase
MSKEDILSTYGEAASTFWNGDGPPPASVDRSDRRHPANDPLYADVDPEMLTGGDSFETMSKRVLAFFEGEIMPQIKAGKSVLVVTFRYPMKAILEHLHDVHCDPAVKDRAVALSHSTLPIVLEFTAGGTGNPVLLMKYCLNSFAPHMSAKLKPAGKVVFLRHGESECNFTGAFTGWEDSKLTTKGEKEATDAGRLLKEEGWKFDVIFTSVLSRALDSVQRVCQESGNSTAPLVKSWRLNARHPGVLQGMTKPEAVKAYGKDKVGLWRASFDVMPDSVPLSDPRHPVNDPLYAYVPQHDLPAGGESLEKVIDRIVPFWREQVVPRIQKGETILLLGHKNSMKALFMYLENTAVEDMFDVRPVSSTAPFVFEFGDSGHRGGLQVVSKYWIKHTEEEALAKARCKDGSLHM